MNRLLAAKTTFSVSSLKEKCNSCLVCVGAHSFITDGAMRSAAGLSILAASFYFFFSVEMLVMES